MRPRGELPLENPLRAFVGFRNLVRYQPLPLAPATPEYSAEAPAQSAIRCTRQE